MPETDTAIALTDQQRATIAERLFALGHALDFPTCDKDAIKRGLREIAHEIDPASHTGYIRVTLNLGTARAVADYCAGALDEAVRPTAEEAPALRAFARTVAGPVHGDPLGHALDRAGRTQ